MSRTTLNRLAKLEHANAPPKEPVDIMLIAADDPEAEQLMAEHEDRPGVTLIVLTGVHRSPEGIVS